MAPARNPFAPKSLLIPYRHKIRAGLHPASFLTSSDRMLVNGGASGMSADNERIETERFEGMYRRSGRDSRASYTELA